MKTLTRLLQFCRVIVAIRPVDDLKRPPASPADEANAKHIFPYRTCTPVSYVDAEGDLQIWKVYARMKYRDTDLDIWLQVVAATIPLASEWNEEHALALFPYLSMSPVQYVRTEWGYAPDEFSFDHYRYRNPELAAWLGQVGKLLRSSGGSASAPDAQSRPSSRQHSRA